MELFGIWSLLISVCISWDAGDPRTSLVTSGHVTAPIGKKKKEKKKVTGYHDVFSFVFFLV